MQNVLLLVLIIIGTVHEEICCLTNTSRVIRLSMKMKWNVLLSLTPLVVDSVFCQESPRQQKKNATESRVLKKCLSRWRKGSGAYLGTRSHGRDKSLATFPEQDACLVSSFVPERNVAKGLKKIITLYFCYETLYAILCTIDKRHFRKPTYSADIANFTVVCWSVIWTSRLKVVKTEITDLHTNLD